MSAILDSKNGAEVVIPVGNYVSVY